MAITEEEAVALVKELSAALMQRRQAPAREGGTDALESYFGGDHPLPEATDRVRAEYKRLLAQARSNWPELVVSAPADRLEVQGLAAATDAASDDLWALWQANGMDADIDDVISSSLALGTAFVLVWPDDELGALISPEHASEVIVAYMPGRRRVRRAALKTWFEGTSDRQVQHATLYTVDEVWKFTAPAGAAASSGASWVRRDVDGEPWPLRHDLGAVPVVEVPTLPGLRPRPYGGGQSEFGRHVDLIDRINQTVFHRLMAQEFGAFKQKYVIGWEPDEELDEDGVPTGRPKQTVSSVDRLLVFASAEVKVGQFTADDLLPYLRAAEQDVQHLSAITRTPPNYLLGAMVNVSADAISAAEAGLVKKVRRHQKVFGEAIEEVMRLAARAAGAEGADDLALEVVWSDPETRSEAERADAATKLKSIGLPLRWLCRRLGMTPQEIDDVLAEVEIEQTLATALMPPAPTVTTPQQGAPDGSQDQLQAAAG